MHNRRIIIKDIMGYSGSSVIATAFGFFAGFWVARLLGPSDFGIWNAVSLVLVYGAYLEFGVLSAMGRDLPFCHGQGDVKKAATLDGAARQVTIFGSLIAALFVFAFSFLPAHSPKMALGLQAMAVVLVLQQVYTYHRIVLRSHNYFKELSQQQVLLALVSFVLAVILVAFWGLPGRMIAAITAQAAIVLYALRRNPWLSAPKFKLSVVWELMRVGVPITMTGFILSLLATIDRVMVIAFLGENQLGYFGLALLLTGVVSLIPTMASQVLYPRITYRFGSTERSIEALRSYVLTPPVILSAFLPLVIGPLYLVLPIMVRTFLPAYIPGIVAAKIVVVGIFFNAILGLTDYFLVTTGKLRQYALFGCVALAFNILLNFLFICNGNGIEGIAVGGTLLTYFFYSCIVIGYALSHYTRLPLDWAKYFFRLWMPFLYMIALLWFVQFLMNCLIPSISRYDFMFATLAQILLYLLCFLPLLYMCRQDLRLAFRTDQSHV